jgi:hypothetical protein
MQRIGLILAFVGAVLVAVMGLASGRMAMQQPQDCPGLQAAPPANQTVYLTEREIRLGGRVCLALKRSGFFQSEGAELTAAQNRLVAARTALAAVPPGTSTDSAQATLAQAQTALESLSTERTLFVFLDDVKVPGQGVAVSVLQPPDQGDWTILEFPLQSTADASSADGANWRRILGGPKAGGVRSVRVGVGVGAADGTTPVRTRLRQQATFRVYDPIWLAVGGLGILLLAGGIAMAGWNTGLLRDRGPTSPFSLGRVQMAWWLIITIGGFLFIWLLSGQWRGVVTTGTMALIGISATTGVAARLTDDPPEGDPGRKTQNFWLDIVSDGMNPAVHRLQLIAWTILLGGIFAWTVIWTFAFPDFDSNLLLLVGIVGGTYVGFKFKEPDAAGSS